VKRNGNYLITSKYKSGLEKILICELRDLYFRMRQLV
jgi:hypothetical protein